AVLPSTLSGMQAYRRTGQLDHRAVRWAAPRCVAGAAVGALLTKWVDPRILLLITAFLIAWQARRVASGPAVDAGSGATVAPSGTAFALMGLIAGFASGLLGIGGGVIMVPVMVTILGMPLKRAIGTSLVAISFMVIPGTIVH